MKKNKFIGLFLLINIFLCALNLTGCKGVSNATYIKVNENDYDNHDKCFIIHSQHDLYRFFDETGFYKNELKKYNDNFFKKNSILIFNYNDDCQNVIDSYSISNETITINLISTDSNNEDNENYYYYFLELKNKEMTKINNLKVYKNNLRIIDENKINKLFNLTTNIKDEIITTFVSYETNIGSTNFNKENTNILYYIGEINNCYIAIIESDSPYQDEYTDRWNGGNIENEYFYFTNERIGVYKENKFYDFIPESYDQKILNFDEIKSIYNEYLHYLKRYDYMHYYSL